MRDGRHRRRSALPALGLLALLGAGALTAASAASTPAQETSGPPMEVTTDTPEYCLHLLDRISELVRLATSPVPREVTDLTSEGQRMCVHGQTRGGIMRLRSALMIMEKPDGPAYR